GATGDIHCCGGAAGRGRVRRRLGGCGRGWRWADPAAGTAHRPARRHRTGHCAGHQQGVVGLGNGDQLDHLRDQDQAGLADHRAAGGRRCGWVGARCTGGEVPAEAVLHPDRARCAGRGGHLHLAQTRARDDLPPPARRASALPPDGRDRARCRRLRRHPRPRHRVFLRDLARRSARVRLLGGQRQGEDRQPSDQPRSHRRFQRLRVGVVEAGSDDGGGQPGRWVPGSPDGDQPRQRVRPQGVPGCAGRAHRQAGLRHRAGVLL
ncbi:MAG: hypothetical protein AVDCRST_MAG75-1159, partial [uncultured Propionibacteriaceae bacterium]